MSFKKLNNFSLVATFFSLWLAVFFEDVVEDIFAYLLIFTFGILHGANDLKLISHYRNAMSDSRRFSLTFLYYILFVAVCALLFYFFAPLALLIFILFSAYHFGEQHWALKLKKAKWLNGIFYTSYGLLLLLLLFTSHSTEVSKITKEIAGISVHTDYYNYSFWLSSLTTSMMYGIIKKRKVFTWMTLREFFYICLFFYGF